MYPEELLYNLKYVGTIELQSFKSFYLFMQNEKLSTQRDYVWWGSLSNTIALLHEVHIDKCYVEYNN